MCCDRWTDDQVSVWEDFGGSELSSTREDRKLVMATTEAPIKFRKQDLRRQYTYTGETWTQGSFSQISSFESICGYVTSDIRKSSDCTSAHLSTKYTNTIDWPVYCGLKEVCNTLNEYLECCTAYSTWPVTSTEVQTLTSELRNQLTTTITSTYLNTNYYNYTLRGCGGWQVSSSFAEPENVADVFRSTCYDYSATASCTGDCTSNNVVCTDKEWPFCASLYMSKYINSDTTAAHYAQSWFCDTAAYGLSYDVGGYWPSVTVPYTSVYNETYASSTPPTWTPVIVPFTQQQMSMPASGVTAPTPTATSGASTYGLMRYLSVFNVIGLWMLVVYIT